MNGIEVIRWHKYPLTHPLSPNPVLVTYKWADDDYEVGISEFWNNSTDYGFGKFDNKVIAWAMLPEPYMEQNE